MIKSVFVSPQHLDGIENSGANHLIVAREKLSQETWKNINELGIELSLSINGFGKGDCPANPQSKEKLFRKINESLEFQPKQIWIDHFRFDGHWEAVEGNKIPEIHNECRFCKGKSRVGVLGAIAKETMHLVNGGTKIGYFAVPFKTEEVPELVTGLGQDHLVIGRIFDISSPMLYQQMIKKPISYISKYVSWLSDKTHKSVLPLIQIKTMPNALEDTITEAVIETEFQAASKVPSAGVCFFWWTHALEKNKTGIIKKLFSS